ncbi:MAG: hypothetical protein U5L01_10205 [Rheinheimera sp.]|nr:hypothetical protein [Rheinheimera sp.]
MPKFLERKKDGPIVVFNAWTLDLKRANVCGFDLLVDLALEFEDFNFYCFIGDLNSSGFFTDFCKRKGVDNVYGIYGFNLTDYLSSADDVFLRLNREDAYGFP